jgi:AraC-like DNA-binding protein
MLTTIAAAEHNAPDEASLWPAAVSAGEVVYPPGASFGPRFQHNLQLVAVYTGSMTVWIDEAARVVAAGNICILFPGHWERFVFAPHSTTRHTWLHAFVPRAAPPLLARLAQLPWPLPLSPAMAELDRATREAQDLPLTTAQPVLKAIAAQMLWRYIGEGERATVAAPLHPAIERAQQFVQTHLDATLNLQLVAAAAAVSPAHLTRLFRTTLHTTPMAYVWQQRVRQGIALLEQTGLTLAAIAETCGFQNSFHFSRRVKQATGHTPLELRRRAWGTTRPAQTKP